MANANQHLAKMIEADPELYGRILDTPSFAFHFNQLCLLADARRTITSHAPNEAPPLTAEERAGMVAHAKMWARGAEASGCAAGPFDKDVVILRYEATVVALESQHAAATPEEKTNV